MVQQVVVQTRAQQSPDFEVVDNPDALVPTSFTDRSRRTRIPDFGSYDLLRLGAFAIRAQFRVSRLQLVDAVGSPIDRDEEDSISSDLIAALADLGALPAANLLREIAPGWTVVGLELITPELDSWTLRRNGVAVSNSVVALQKFLKRAWESLRFR